MTKKINTRLYRRRRLVPGSNLVPLAEFARRQHVAPSTVRGWIAERKIVAYRAGGKWYISVDSLNKEPLYWSTDPLVGI